MSLFDNILKDSESLFVDETSLDYDYLPKLLPYRENQQYHVVSCIKPLFEKKNGRNLLIIGQPGIGKTAAVRFVLRDLEQETDEIIPIYINCWKKNTSHKIVLEICNQINYKFTQNKTTEELFNKITDVLNKKTVVFALDEIDKLEDNSILYLILEEIYKKTILLITNEKKWFSNLDLRINSRLMAEILEFKPYNLEEATGILKQRCDHAFIKGVWDNNAFGLICQKSFELEDIRVGMFLLRETGNIAESKASRNILEEHANVAISKLKDYKIKSSKSLEKEENLILGIIKENSGKQSTDVYQMYKERTGKSYRTFSRKIKYLEKNKLISIKNITTDLGGQTSILSYGTIKKLTDFKT